MTELYPLYHPLGSASLKVNRANEHIEALNKAVSDALPAKTAAWEERELEGIGKIKEALVDASRPPQWAAIIGDILGNLRQSLDHIAWALAERQAQYRATTLSDDEAKNIIFPLYTVSGAYQACKALPFIWSPAIPDIEQLQPYPARFSKRPELELLAILQELSNADKHRVVTPVAMKYPIAPWDTSFIDFFGDFDHGGQPTRILLPPAVVAKLGDQLEPETAPIIGIQTEIRGGRLIGIWELPLIHDLIRDEIIPLFARHFPKLPGAE